MKTFNDIDWDSFSEDVPVDGFHLVERRFWVVRCDKCNHQITGPVPQTDKARNMLVNQLMGKKCNNCLWLASLGDTMRESQPGGEE